VKTKAKVRNEFLFFKHNNLIVGEKYIMYWLNDIPTRVNKDGYLEALPNNTESTAKTVKDVTPKLKNIVEQRIANKFQGVLS